MVRRPADGADTCRSCGYLQTVRTVRMPPGTAYALRLGLVPSEVVEFSVGPDGVVDYGPEYERALSGRGTARLRVTAGRRHGP